MLVYISIKLCDFPFVFNWNDNFAMTVVNVHFSWPPLKQMYDSNWNCSLILKRRKEYSHERIRQIYSEMWNQVSGKWDLFEKKRPMFVTLLIVACDCIVMPSDCMQIYVANKSFNHQIQSPFNDHRPNECTLLIFNSSIRSGITQATIHCAYLIAM